MSVQWLRLWHDLPNDPKWRTIARVSGQPVSAVIACYIHLLVIASNATERGRTHGVCSEDLASALDLETEQVEAIMSAMQGRVLCGDMVSGWEKRQVGRDDGAAERAKRWREARKKAERTQPNATERNRTPDKDKDKDKDTDTEKSKIKSVVVSPTAQPPPGENIALVPNRKPRQAIGTRLPSDWHLSQELGDWALAEGLTRERIRQEAERFRDYWIAKPGEGGRKADWPATWRNWVRRSIETGGNANGKNQPPDRPRSAVDRVNSAISASAREREQREALQRAGRIVDPGGAVVATHDGNLRAPLGERLR